MSEIENYINAELTAALMIYVQKFEKHVVECEDIVKKLVDVKKNATNASE